MGEEESLWGHVRFARSGQEEGDGTGQKQTKTLMWVTQDD